MKINLGCGRDKIDGYENVDIDEAVDPDIEMDITKGLPWMDDSVDEVRAFDVLEHLYPDAARALFDDVWRILRDGGIFNIQVPSTDGRGAFQNLLHRSFWNANSFFYWTTASGRKEYGTRAKFEGRPVHRSTGVKVIHVSVRLRAVKS